MGCAVLCFVLSPALLAHQGGWDELLMVVTPIAVFALLLRAANRRAARIAEDEDDGQNRPGAQS